VEVDPDEEAVMLALLKANPITAGLAALCITFGATAGVQTWRIGNLQQDIGAARSELSQCVATNQRNMDEYRRVIGGLMAQAQERNRKLQEQAALIQRLRTWQVEQEAQDDEDIEAIQAVESDCAAAPVPDAIRLRLTRSH
jgi:hypothetical protein